VGERLNWIGVATDPTDGMCKCTPTPDVPVNMCPELAGWHVLVVEGGVPVSLLVCHGHYGVACSLGDHVLTFHPVEAGCFLPGRTRLTLIEPATGISHCQSL
jgi:hypothetical protein